MLKPYLFSETAFHHEGDINYLLQLIDHSSLAGVQGIKFQVLLDLNELVSTANPAYEKLKDYIFTYDNWRMIFQYAIEKQLDIIVMPLDKQSCGLIEEFKTNVKFVELHSVAFHDEELKIEIKKSGSHLILGAGGRTQSEIEEAKLYFGDQLKVLMIGFQAFPSAIQDIRIRKISDLQAQFPQLAIGYADHTSYADEWNIESNLVAYSLGATFFEKHITIEEGLQRVDYEAAVNFTTLQKIQKKLTEVHSILHGYNDPFEMTAAEINYRNRQKMVVAKWDIQSGTRLESKHLKLKMVGRFDGFQRKEDLIGKILINSLDKDNIIKKEDVNN